MSDDTTMSVCDAVVAGAGPPEPFTVWTDVNNASTALEKATYATDSATCSGLLSQAAVWIRYVQDHAGSAGDEDMAHRAACIATTLEQWSASVPTDPNAMALFQGNLYQYQGVLIGLLAHEDQSLVAGANLAVAGVLAALLWVFGTAAYIDYKNEHGGYSRGPRPTVRPVTTLRY